MRPIGFGGNPVSTTRKVIILAYMKKKYLEPEVRVAQVGFEVNFLTSNFNTGGSTGEDLDDPNPFDPWS